MGNNKIFDKDGNFILRNKATKSLDDLSREFISKMGHSVVMNQEELLKDLELYRHGDLEAKERLINENMRLVIYVAKSYRKKLYNLEFSDLVHEGFFGLLHAIEMYEPCDTPFKVYANTCILRYVNSAINKYESTVKRPDHIWAKRKKFLELYNKCINENQNLPSLEELRKKLVVDYDSIMSIAQLDRDILSLEELDENDESLVVSDDYLFTKFNQENDRQLLIVLKELLEPEYYFIMFSKLLNNNRVTNVDLGEYFGVTHESIRLKEVAYLKKIRPVLLIDKIRKYKYEEACSIYGEKIADYDVMPIIPEKLYMYHFLHDVIGLGLDNLYYLKYLTKVRYSDDEIMEMLGFKSDVYEELVLLLNKFDNDSFRESDRYKLFVEDLISNKKFKIYDVVRNDKEVEKLIEGRKLTLEV